MGSPPPVTDGIRTLLANEVRRAIELGWALIALSGKRPIDKSWTTKDPLSLEQALAHAKRHNIGLLAGTISGVVVIDDDTDDGSAAEMLNLPETVTAITGSGKLHLYFRCPGGGLKNSVGKLGKKIDVRGDGGQVVLPGSVHPDTGQLYKWAPGLSPDDVPLADLPADVIEKLRSPSAASSRSTTKRPKKTRTPRRLRRYAEVALENAGAQLSSTSDGERNDGLNKHAYQMGRFVGAGLLKRGDVENELAAAALSCGLDESEIAETLESGLNTGESEPHDRDELLRRIRHDQLDAADSSKPKIIYEPGTIPEIVSKAEEALLQRSKSMIFERGSVLVQIGERSTPTGKEPQLYMVSIPALIDLMTDAATWFLVDRRSGDLILIDCPEKVASIYNARIGRRKAPTLQGIITAPTLRADGSVLDAPGYDAKSQLFYAPSGTVFDPIPQSPSHADALKALQDLIVVLKDFPFVEESDRAAALAAILTALVRPTLRTAPMFAIRAPTMGSGKSLLADIVALIATGHPALMMSQGKNDDEDKKRLLAILLESHPVVCIDNVERPLGGTALCSVLTQTRWMDRILGKTQTASVPTNATCWLTTGNNLVIDGDLTSRVVPCDLDPGCENPEERQFDVNLHEFIPKNRGTLVPAGLKILRAYHVAGRPNQNLRQFGRFEHWSDFVRSAIVWCGMDDPCNGRRRLEIVDPVRDRLASVLKLWEKVFGQRKRTAAHALQDLADPETDTKDALLAHLAGIATTEQGQPNAHSLGRWLSTQEGRIIDGRCFVRDGKRYGSTLWRVSGE